MSYIPKFILNIIDNFNVRNIFLWFNDIYNYLTNPKKFVSNYNSKELEEQISQLIFYATLNCLIYFTFGAGQSQQELYRYLFVILMTSIPYILLNIITFFIISKKTEFSLWKIISYVLIGNLIFFIPLPILLNLFIENENYTFLFFVNVCLLMSFLYFLIIIWVGLFNHFLKIFFASVLNIILFNFFYLSIGLIIKDSFSKRNESIDAIIDEFNTHGKEINYPTAKVLNYTSVRQISTNIDCTYVTLSINDSILNIDETGINNYYQELKKNRKYIDSIFPTLHFKRNQEMFKSLILYNRDVVKYFKNPKSTNLLIDKTYYKYKENSKIEFVTEKYKPEKYINTHLDEFNLKYKELEKAKSFASSPIVVVESLLFPANLIVDKLDLKTDKTVTFTLK